MGKLVLTRRIGEEVVIMDESGAVCCTVQVLGRDSGEISLGFEADQKIKIFRKEINYAEKST